VLTTSNEYFRKQRYRVSLCHGGAVFSWRLELILQYYLDELHDLMAKSRHRNKDGKKEKRRKIDKLKKVTEIQLKKVEQHRQCAHTVEAHSCNHPCSVKAINIT
jgi:hypothetical protein